MSITLLPAASRAATPWRNGGGITREIAASPAGASLADFDWRISMAEISAQGPFSTFQGIDRILTVISGTLTLAIEGQAPVTLSPNTQPFAFPGEAPCVGSPQNGPAADLNVMLRRERYKADLRRTASETGQLNTNICVLVALNESAATVSERTFQLNQFDALLIENHANVAIALQGIGYIVEIKAR